MNDTLKNYNLKPICGKKGARKPSIPRGLRGFYNFPNMKQYRDTRFDDPKPFTWDELKEKAKKMGCDIHASIWLKLGKNCLVFKENGVVEVVDTNLMTTKLSTNRSYEQMLAIMKALQ